MGSTPNDTVAPGDATVIKWTGPSDRPMFLIHDYYYFTFDGVQLNASGTATYAIESRWTSGVDGFGTGTGLHTKDVHILNATVAGIAFTGGNGNNDQFALRDLWIKGCPIGIHLPNNQSVWGQLDNVFISDSTTAAIKTSASITCYNLTTDNNVLDLQIDSTARVNLFGWNSERSGKIFDITSEGILGVWGGSWVVGSQMQGAAAIATAPALRGNITLQTVRLTYQIAPKPPIFIRCTAAGSNGPYVFAVRGCMGITLDVLDYNGYGAVGHSYVDIDSQGIKINQNTLTDQLVDPNQTSTATSFTVTSIHRRVVMNATNGQVVLRSAQYREKLPPVVIKNVNATPLTVSPVVVGQTIDGANTLTLNQWQSTALISDGTNWITI